MGDLSPIIFLEQKNKGLEKRMPEKASDVYFKQNRLYDIIVKIKNLDYTKDLVSVDFASSLSTAYQVVDLVFSLDPNDVIIEEVFGGAPIKLSITLYRENTFPGPRIDVDLMYVKSDFLLTEKTQASSIGDQTIKDRTPLLITTVAREPFKIMTTLVNDVFIGNTIREVITSLSSDVGATLKMDSDGENTEVIDQVCIPPTTFYKAIKEHNRMKTDLFDGFLDQRFGLFMGTPGVFCQYDKTVNIKNLTSKLKKSQIFTVYQLSSQTDAKIQDKIFNECMKGNTFYTYDTIRTDYSGNAKFAELGKDIYHIVKPNKTITSLVTQDLETIAKTYSLFYSEKNTDLFIDKSTNRTKYYNEDTGYNTSPTVFNSRFGRLLSDLSSITLNLERNLPVMSLIDVGECVKFKPQTLEYNDLEGKYILWSSILKFRRPSGDWASTATINLIRTNKKN
jgi:hypothetical protein